jgi:hypothetical protein
MQTVISKIDVKRALDNCMREHVMVDGKGGLPPDAYALGETYAAMLRRGLESLPSFAMSQEAIAALARWEEHTRSSLH